MRLEEFTIEGLEPEVGSTFTVSRSDGTTVDLKFVSVRRIMERADPKTLKRLPFTMYFTGPATSFLPQSTYAMSHPTLGALNIFIVPTGRDDAGFHYEAVFT
jgi:hypothetical protein